MAPGEGVDLTHHGGSEGRRRRESDHRRQVGEGRLERLVHGPARIGQTSVPTSARRRLMARDRRDFTVPRGTSRAAAMDASSRSTNQRRPMTRRSSGLSRPMAASRPARRSSARTAPSGMGLHRPRGGPRPGEGPGRHAAMSPAGGSGRRWPRSAASRDVAPRPREIEGARARRGRTLPGRRRARRRHHRTPGRRSGRQRPRIGAPAPRRPRRHRVAPDPSAHGRTVDSPPPGRTDTPRPPARFPAVMPPVWKPVGTEPMRGPGCMGHVTSPHPRGGPMSASTRIRFLLPAARRHRPRPCHRGRRARQVRDRSRALRRA